MRCCTPGWASYQGIFACGRQTEVPCHWRLAMPIDLRRSPSGESGEGDSCWRFQIAFEPDRKRCENGLQGENVRRFVATDWKDAKSGSCLASPMRTPSIQYVPSSRRLIPVNRLISAMRSSRTFSGKGRSFRLAPRWAPLMMWAWRLSTSRIAGISRV